MGREEIDSFKESRPDPSGREKTVTGQATHFGQDLDPQEEYIGDGLRGEGGRGDEKEEKPRYGDGTRSAQEVFENHQSRVRTGDLSGDFRENYADEAVLVTGSGIHRGRKALSAVLMQVDQRIVGAKIENRSCFVHGDLAFAEWEALTPTGERLTAAETFVIRNGRIIAQTLHYETEK